MTVVTRPANKCFDFFFAASVEVVEDKSIIFIFNNRERPLKLDQRQVIGSFIEVSDEILAYKAKIVNSEGRVDELKDRKNMESHPWMDANFRDKFELGHLNRKPELCEKSKSMIIKYNHIFGPCI